MGNTASNIFSGLGRFFEYPVKRKPICFYRQEDFTATGEPLVKTTEVQKPAMTDYDKLVDLFYKRLAEQRQYNQEMKEQDRRWSMQKVVRRFPGWNEVTIANLHSLFLLFDNQANGMLGFEDLQELSVAWLCDTYPHIKVILPKTVSDDLELIDLLKRWEFGMCWNPSGSEYVVLESLGDETMMEQRKEKFSAADTDNDGWITYDEFLSLVYNFSDPEEDGSLSGLALLCNEVASNIQFVSNLTVGEQLEYGLF